MSIAKFTKQPHDTLDYDFDFSKWFAGRSDTIASAVVTVEAGLTLVTYEITGKVVKVVLAGGTDGQAYKVMVRITTTSSTPLVKEVDMQLRVKET